MLSEWTSKSVNSKMENFVLLEGLDELCELCELRESNMPHVISGHVKHCLVLLTRIVKR